MNDLLTYCIKLECGPSQDKGVAGGDSKGELS